MSQTTLNHVPSKDGTSIAYETVGNGPALVLVGGALSDRFGAGALVDLLKPHFTVVTFDRRGRGDSGDTQPYAVEREIEDIEAIINAVGGEAFVYGMSSGAVLSLHTANTIPSKVKKLFLYEPPFITDDSRPMLPADYTEHLRELIAANRRGDAVEYFMTAAVGMPAEFVGQMRQAPMWAGLEKVAHTIAYDGEVMGNLMSGNPIPTDLWQNATMPVMVVGGGASEAWMRKGAKSAAALLPNGTYRMLEGQDHNVAPDALAPLLIEFFTT